MNPELEARQEAREYTAKLIMSFLLGALFAFVATQIL